MEKFFQVYTENGSQQTGLDAFEWAQLGEKYGVGEILLTSIDNEGMQNGFELNLQRDYQKYFNTFYSLWWPW